MTAKAIEAVLTERTKLIVVVHTYGNVCDMDDILSLAESRGVLVRPLVISFHKDIIFF